MEGSSPPAAHAGGWGPSLLQLQQVGHGVQPGLQQGWACLSNDPLLSMASGYHPIVLACCSATAVPSIEGK